MFSAKNQNNDLVDCYCSRIPMDTETSYYRFKFEDVWSGPMLFTTTKSSLISQNEHTGGGASIISSSATMKTFNPTNIVYIFILIFFLIAIMMIFKYRKSLQNKFHGFARFRKKSTPEQDETL